MSRAEATREAIFDAALVCFAERGFHGTSIADIAQRAAIGQGTIYRHFESKEALGRALYLRTKHRSGEYLAALDVPGDPRGAFRALFLGSVAWARTNPQAASFLELHHHQVFLDDASVREGNLVHQVTEAWFEGAKAAGVVKALPTPVLMAVVFGIYVHLLRSWVQGELELEDAVAVAAEQCAWDAIAAR